MRALGSRLGWLPPPADTPSRTLYVAVDPEGDRAGLGLVDDVGRLNLERDGGADRGAATTASSALVASASAGRGMP